MRNCYGCGHQIHEDAQFCPNCGAPGKPPKKKIETLPSLRNSNNPFYWMRIVFKRCAFVEGRASRKEYFLGVLPFEIMKYILFIVLTNSILSGGISTGGALIIELFAILVSAVFFTTSYVRRLHDIGRSGWEILTLWAFFVPAVILDIAQQWGYGSSLTVKIMLLFYLLRGVAGLWIFILMFRKGYTKENRFGPQPII